MSLDLEVSVGAPNAAPQLRHGVIPGLPADFVWGAATSAYQIEGAVDSDGRGRSIWDTFSHTPGAVDNSDNGDVACDHYHRMPEDVAIIANLGLDAYRFSLAWPRIQPGGRGAADVRGVAFYDRLVDELLARGITPWATLYHWDLPQELEDAGGWTARDTAFRFADYAELAVTALGDRVRHWITLNEPYCSAILGYGLGLHAPGRKHFPSAIKSVHHLLLGHGLAVPRLRSGAHQQLTVGITLNPTQVYPASDSPADQEAARRADGFSSRLFLDPVIHGRYPTDVMADLAERDAALPIEDGDLQVIAQPLDFLGINYYYSEVHAAKDEPGDSRVPQPDRPVTAMPWEIHAQGLTDLLIRVSDDYPSLPLYVTENGAAFDDDDLPVDDEGRIQDAHRTAYIADHLAAVGSACLAGADVRGYFVWSLLDNFEWAYGYDKRFGIVQVDLETQRRTPKQSALWLSETAKASRTRP